MQTHTVTTPDGRELAVVEAGDPNGPAMVAHHGTPGCGLLHPAELVSASERGVRLISYDRPGYGESSPHRGRSAADAAVDVVAIADALGVERYGTYGSSGGGPHALACAALDAGRCVAVATMASVGPADAPDLDFLAGMGEGNIEEFGVARQGHTVLTAFVTGAAAELSAITPDELADAIRPHLSPVDAAALNGELAEHMLQSIRQGIASGVEGWVDDDLVFLKPWGFDVGAITVPVLLWQGEQDLMVPVGHGRWLAGHVAGAEARSLPDEGHLTLFVNRVGDTHAWLAEHL